MEKEIEEEGERGREDEKEKGSVFNNQTKF